MLPIKNILCPTDFSEPSFKGIEVAKELSEYFSAKLNFINVVTPVFPVGAPGVPASYSAEEYYTDKVVRLATCPVLTVTEPKEA